MDRRILICLIVMALSLPLPVNAASPQPRELRPHASFDVLIPGYNHYTVSITGLVEGDDISIDIQVTSGNTLSFICIFDEENYNPNNINRNVAAKMYDNEWDLTATFSVPASGTWYVVFVNGHATDVQVEGSVVSVSQQARGTLYIVIIIIVLISVFICVCYICLKRQRNKDTKKQPQLHPYAEQPAQSPQYRPAPQQEETFRFCPYCGTQRQSPDVQFCSRCGKAFND